MQDFRSYDFTMTLEQLHRAMTEDCQSVVAIINGEYYDIIPPSPIDEKESPKTCT